MSNVCGNKQEASKQASKVSVDQPGQVVAIEGARIDQAEVGAGLDQELKQHQHTERGSVTAQDDDSNKEGTGEASHLDQLRLVVSNGDVQRRVAVVVLEVQVRSGSQQRDHAIGVTCPIFI
jgi:hypothetical protein